MTERGATPRNHRNRQRSTAINGLQGFVNVRRFRAREHATLWVEGMDGREPSVSAVALPREAVTRLRDRLTAMLEQWPKFVRRVQPLPQRCCGVPVTSARLSHSGTTNS